MKRYQNNKVGFFKVSGDRGGLRAEIGIKHYLSDITYIVRPKISLYYTNLHKLLRLSYIMSNLLGKWEKKNEILQSLNDFF